MLVELPGMQDVIVNIPWMWLPWNPYLIRALTKPEFLCLWPPKIDTGSPPVLPRGPCRSETLTIIFLARALLMYSFASSYHKCHKWHDLQVICVFCVSVCRIEQCCTLPWGTAPIGQLLWMARMWVIVWRRHIYLRTCTISVFGTCA